MASGGEVEAAKDLLYRRSKPELRALTGRKLSLGSGQTEVPVVQFLRTDTSFFLSLYLFNAMQNNT